MKTSATQRLLGAAGSRMRLSEYGRGFHRGMLIAAGLALAGILCARLLALLPVGWFTPITLLAVPGAALLLAFLFLRRRAPGDVARVVDARAGTKELFLTAALIAQSPGEYRGIVAEQAEARAGELKAARLLPFAWASGARDIVIAGAVLAAAVLWLPKMDPFKMGEKRDALTKQEERLAETKKITALRKDELKEKGSVLNEQVEQAMAKLDKTLKEMKPAERELNAKKLNEEAQDFSELWKKASAQLPKDALEKMEKAAQNFGDPQDQKAVKEMIEKLKKGDAEPLKKAMENMKKEMERIAKMGDGAEKKEATEKLAKEAAKLANQIKQQLGEKGLNEALQRAVEQMDLAKLKNLADKALDGANQSLELGQKEAERLAEMFKDMEALEDAMKNLAAAKQLNEKGKLDGKDAEDAKTMEDYEQLYKNLMDKIAKMGEGGDGQGDGQGDGDGQGKGKSGKNPGIGKGGNIGENDAATSNFKKEKSNSQIGAGKLLMEWKEEGIGDIGKKGDDYQAAVRALKQSVSEAIRNEQVPPGYHGTIQKYFDRMPEKQGK